MKQPLLSRYLPTEVLRQLAGCSFDPRGLVAGNLAGPHRSPAAGFAVEFAGHREYTPGDDLRRLDWRVYFAREKYVVKQYDLETNFTCHLVLDVSGSMQYHRQGESKRDYGARLAAALAYAILRQRDKVSLAMIADRVRGFLPASNALDQILRMTAELDAAGPAGPTDLSAALHDLAARYLRREMVVVISDFLTDLPSLERALQKLKYFQHEVLLMQLLDQDELAFEFSENIRFRDLERGAHVTVAAADIRHRYLQAMRAFLERLETMAVRNDCEWLLLNTGRDLGTTLHEYLHRRRADRG